MTKVSTNSIKNEYKPSGIDWLGDVPAGWDFLPVRAILRERKEKNAKLEESNILSVMKGVGVIRYENKGNVGNKSSERPEAYKIVRKNDLVLNSMNLSIGSVGMAHEDGVTSSVYIIYQARPEIADPGFYNYLFQTTSFQRHLASYGRGIMELREAVKERDIKNQPVIVPPLGVQKRIADFLDEKTKVIDELIERKENLIELLREKRAALITRAVTKGLNPNAKLKPSGADWLGDIPEGWETEPLKSLFIYQTGGAWGDEERFDENDIACIRVADFDFLRLITHSDEYTRRNLPEVKKHLLLTKQSILLEKSGGGDQSPVGRAVRYTENEKAICSNFIQKLEVGSKFDPEFVVYLLAALYFLGVTKKAIKQTTGIQNLDLGYFFRTPVFYPQINEQEKIAGYINVELSKIVDALKKNESQIDKLKEYRSSLIYHAVTGKMKI